MQARPIALCAMPFGYGPAAKLLAIAAELGALGRPSIFIGSGIAAELAARSGSLFSDLIVATAAESRAAEVVRSAAGVVSVMDREFAALACSLGTPLYIVDSLLWMRDHIPEPFESASRYWTQNFVGVREGPAATRVRPVTVGPIVCHSRPSLPPRAARLIVQLGGYESPVTDLDSPYAAFVVEAILASRLGAAFAGSITVLAGGHCIERLRSDFGQDRLTFASLAHDDAAREFANASLVLTAPGLTATLECFQLGVPAYFLPPQNYSQWCILRALRAHGLAPYAFHWEDLRDEPPIEIGMPEAVRNPLVGNAIRELAQRRDAQQHLQAQLSQILDDDAAALRTAQRTFFQSLGPNGAVRIARDLEQLARN